MLEGLVARYGGRSTVTVLAGDGIGPEMLQHVTRIFEFGNVCSQSSVTSNVKHLKHS